MGNESVDQKAKCSWRQGCPGSSWTTVTLWWAGGLCRCGGSVARRARWLPVKRSVTYHPQRQRVKREAGLSLTMSGYCFWVRALTHLGWAMKSHETFLQQFTAGSCKPLLVLAQARLIFPEPRPEILFQTHTGPSSVTTAKISLVARQMFRWFPPQIVNPTLSPGTKPILLKPQPAFGGNVTPVHWKVCKSSPSSEFVTNPPKQAKCPWF